MEIDANLVIQNLQQQIMEYSMKLAVAEARIATLTANPTVEAGA
jgi:hypothetical protein